MSDKLSREELLKRIKSWKRGLIELGKKIDIPIWQEKDEQAYSQIKSRLTSVPEEKKNEFVEKWARIMEAHNDLWSIEDRVKELLKEYDNLREGKEG